MGTQGLNDELFNLDDAHFELFKMLDAKWQDNMEKYGQKQKPEHEVHYLYYELLKLVDTQSQR